MDNKNISNQRYDHCCGCKACGDVCPQNAITYQTDAEGFFYPEVSNACVECGLCRRACPELNVLGPSGDVKQKYYACLDKNITRRNTGSSGGIFGLLASHLLREGYEVCGAAFDNRLRLSHQFAINETELERLKKSKYLQSDCKGIYVQVVEKLKQQKKVLFVGTPCQCNALRNVASRYREHLITIDFACHGVPSQELFDKCIAYYEKHHDSKVLSYTFRHKPKRYSSPQNYLLSVEKDGKIHEKAGRYYEEPFYCGFQKYLTLRPSCYSCHWANTDRVADATLADFWGIEECTDRWDRTDHPSLVIVNSAKGQTLFDSINQDTEKMEVSREEAVKGNGSLIKPTKLKAARAQLFADYQSMDFDSFVEKHLTLHGRWKKDVYYTIPFGVRKVILEILNKI